MKRKRSLLLLLFLLVSAIIIILWSCDLHVTATGDAAIQECTLKLKGRIIDKYTKKGIYNAKVIINYEFEVNTDYQGYFQIDASTVGNGNADIYATAPNYGYGSTIASIDMANKATALNIIQLLPLNTPVPIGNEGGTIQASSTEGIGNNTISFNIPIAALNQTTSISVTSFEGIDVPGLSPENYLNMSSVNLEPSGTMLQTNAVLSVPLPISANKLDSLPLLYYNKNARKWFPTGEYAAVDSTTNRAIVNVRTLNLYSIGIRGYYEEARDADSVIDDGKWKKRNTTTRSAWMASVIYPNGIQDGFNTTWLKNIVSQNTRLAGRTSFIDSTYTMYNTDSTNYSRIRIIIIRIPENVCIWYFDKYTRRWTKICILNKLFIRWPIIERHDQGMINE